MSDTPRTDRAQQEATAAMFGGEPVDVTRWDFAREMERENERLLTRLAELGDESAMHQLRPNQSQNCLHKICCAINTIGGDEECTCDLTLAGKYGKLYNEHHALKEENERLIQKLKHKGIACDKHDLVGGWACPRCLANAEQENEQLKDLLKDTPTADRPPLSYEAGYDFDSEKEIIALKEENDRLRGLLSVAQCPNCDGSGCYPVHTGVVDSGVEECMPEQCQWCFEKHEALATKEGGSE